MPKKSYKHLIINKLNHKLFGNIKTIPLPLRRIRNTMRTSLKEKINSKMYQTKLNIKHRNPIIGMRYGRPNFGRHLSSITRDKWIL